MPTFEASLEREKKFVCWLEFVRKDAEEIMILGDLFDFWFEYQTVVPKGFIRVLGKLAELRDSGIVITLFSGNHDLWLKDYFPKYLGIPIIHQPIVREWFGKRFYLAHGDGLGPGDLGYKLMNKLFRNRIAQWFFRKTHPDFGIWLANFFSNTSRNAHLKYDQIDYGEKERLYQFVKQYVTRDNSIDYFIFGHRHLPRNITINSNSKMIILGDWITHFSYLKINEMGVELDYFEKNIHNHLDK